LSTPIWTFSPDPNVGALWFGIGAPTQTQVDGTGFVIMIAIAKMLENEFHKYMSNLIKSGIWNCASGKNFTFF
jgi:hypothetical protein